MIKIICNICRTKLLELKKQNWNNGFLKNWIETNPMIFCDGTYKFKIYFYSDYKYGDSYNDNFENQIYMVCQKCYNVICFDDPYTNIEDLTKI